MPVEKQESTGVEKVKVSKLGKLIVPLEKLRFVKLSTKKKIMAPILYK